MTDFIEYLNPERSMRWKINWYNEIKIPMLTAGILFDNGHESLIQRVNELKSIVINNIVPALPEDC